MTPLEFLSDVSVLVRNNKKECRHFHVKLTKNYIMAEIGRLGTPSFSHKRFNLNLHKEPNSEGKFPAAKIRQTSLRRRRVLVSLFPTTTGYE